MNLLRCVSMFNLFIQDHFMENPKIAGKSPSLEELESGKNYAWCACGMSANQPWCNGAHKESTMTPVVFKSDESKTAAMCMCKQTNNPPYCDGSHSSL